MKKIIVEIDDDRYYDALVPTFADVLSDFVEEFGLEGATIPTIDGITWTIEGE